MADSLKLMVITVLLASLATKCLCVCRLQNLDCLFALQMKTNRTIQGKPEWVVVVVNYCLCDLEAVILSCPGFKTIEPIDEKIFLCKPSGTGIILGGYPLSKMSGVRFAYAWDQAFKLCPILANPVTPQCQ